MWVDEMSLHYGMNANMPTNVGAFPLLYESTIIYCNKNVSMSVKNVVWSEMLTVIRFA